MEAFYDIKSKSIFKFVVALTTSFNSILFNSGYNYLRKWWVYAFI